MLLPGLVVGLVALGAPGCGTATSTVASDTHGSADVQAVERHADDRFVQIAGSAEERDASGYLTWLDLNDGYATCMAKAGHAVAMDYLPKWTGWEPSSTSATWMGALHRKPSLHAEATSLAAHAEVSDGQPRSREFNEASNSCHRGSSEIRLGELPGEPVGYMELAGEFKDLVFQVDSKLGPIAPYTDCMKRAGFDYTTLSEGEEGWQGLYMWLTAEMPRAPLPGQEPSLAWTEYLKLEASALDADADCRAGQYLKGLELLAPLLAEFEANHSQEIADVSSGWASTVREATQAGLTS